MSVIPELSTSLGRTDEQANIALAERIAAEKNSAAVRELAEVLTSKDKALKSDAIKVLYEVGAREPLLIAPFIASFKNLLTSPDNRMVWGAMSAIDAIASVKPENVYMLLPQIMQAVDKGSVITRDRAVSALAKLAVEERFARSTMPPLLEQLRNCPVNQLPMYAERVAVPAKGNWAREMEKVLSERLVGVEQEPKRKRIEKVLKKLAKV